MAEFLTTSGTSHYIETIIIEAKGKLFLISPYLKLSKTLFERLKDASNRGVKIKLVYGKDELKPNETNSLASLKNVELYYFQNLHAKCYFNESKMVITSMNMYEFSEKTNREMGVLIDLEKDKELFQKAMSESESILQHSEMIVLNKSERRYYGDPIDTSNKAQKKNAPKMGYCIRCQERISYNASRPYCSNCYSTWAQFENPFYEESICHSCGEFDSSTMEKPLCYACYKKSA